MRLMRVTLGVSDALDRRRQVIVEAGLGRAVVGAEAQHDADLVGQHAVEAARQPQHDDRDERRSRSRCRRRTRRATRRRKRSWPRRSISSRLGGCGPRGPRGPADRRRCRRRRGRRPRAAAATAATAGPVPQGPPPSLCQIIETRPLPRRAGRVARAMPLTRRPRTPALGVSRDRGRAASEVLSSAGRARLNAAVRSTAAARENAHGRVTEQTGPRRAGARCATPTRARDIVSLGMVSGVVIRDGNVGFAIEVEPERGPRLEPLRKAAETGGRGAARRALGDRGADRRGAAARPRRAAARARPPPASARQPAAAGARRARARVYGRSSRSPRARAASANRPSPPIWRWRCRRTGSRSGCSTPTSTARRCRACSGSPAGRRSRDGKILQPMENYGIKMHVDRVSRARGHGDDLARPDGDERAAADAARRRLGRARHHDRRHAARHRRRAADDGAAGAARRRGHRLDAAGHRPASTRARASPCSTRSTCRCSASSRT